MNTASSPAAAPATSAPADPWTARLGRWHLPPPKLLKLYLLIWAPIFLIHMVAVQTDGQLDRDFNLLIALRAAVRNLGPQFTLLLLL